MRLFSSQCDSRWEGRPMHYLTAYLIKNLLLIFFSIFIIAETSLYKKWNGTAPDYGYGGPNNFWLRIGICLIPEVGVTLLTSTLLFRARWHPWAALATSLLLFALWTVGTAFNALLVARNEGEFRRRLDWERLVGAQVVVQVGIACCYAGMAGFAGVAAARLGSSSEVERRVESGEGVSEIEEKR